MSEMMIEEKSVFGSHAERRVLMNRRTLEARARRVIGKKPKYKKLRASKPNRKVGAPSFNLPAGISCIGKTLYCFLLCYAAKGNFNTSSVQNMYMSNWILIREFGDDIAKISQALWEMVVEAVPLRSGIFRIHTSGDLYSQAYLDAWIIVATMLPNIKFWLYSRSFSLDFSSIPDNITVYASADEENFKKAEKFAEKYNFKMAHMAENFTDRKSFDCPEQPGAVKSCAACGLCVHGRGVDVRFKKH